VKIRERYRLLRAARIAKWVFQNGSNCTSEDSVLLQAGTIVTLLNIDEVWGRYGPVRHYKWGDVDGKPFPDGRWEILPNKGISSLLEKV